MIYDDDDDGGGGGDGDGDDDVGDDDPFAITGNTKHVEVSDGECSLHDIRRIGAEASCSHNSAVCGASAPGCNAVGGLLQPLLHRTPDKHSV